MREITIRMAQETDARELLGIYVPYVENTAVTFEYAAPDINEFIRRMKKIQSRYPYLLAEQDGEILGYAYVSVFKERAAYDWAVETTIYIKDNIRGRGIGKQLYSTLERILEVQNIRNLYACIAYPNPDSISFHKSRGYKKIGHFSSCGYKQGVWYDMDGESNRNS